MFTGLIEAVGTLLEVERAPETIRVRVGTDIAGETVLGESVAVNGVCLTVVDNAAGAVSFDISPETARVTTLDGLETRALVNLERSMRADARVGGHFVQGHVDAKGHARGHSPGRRLLPGHGCHPGAPHAFARAERLNRR